MTFHNKIFAVYLFILAVLASAYIYQVGTEPNVSDMKSEYIRMVLESKNVLSRINDSHSYVIERNLNMAIGGLSEEEKASVENSKKHLSEPYLSIKQDHFKQMSTLEMEEWIIQQLTDECSRHDSLEKLEQVSRKAILLFPQFTPVVQIEPKYPKVGDAIKVGISLIDCPLIYNNPNLSLKLDGQAVPMEQGVGHFQHVFRKKGRHKFDIEVSVTNPVTRQTETVNGHSYPIFIGQ